MGSKYTKFPEDIRNKADNNDEEFKSHKFEYKYNSKLLELSKSIKDIIENSKKEKTKDISMSRDDIFYRFFNTTKKNGLQMKSLKSLSKSEKMNLKTVQINNQKTNVKTEYKLGNSEESVSKLSIDSLNQVSNTNSLVPNALGRLGYELHQQIGFGGFSTVYIASNRNLPGVQFACKMFKLNEINKYWIERCLKNEMRIMLKMHHPNIITAYDAIKTRTRAYIFMKFAKNGSIDTYLYKNGGKVNEELAKKWFSGLMSGLAYMHHRNIAHRDLKLDNFLLDDNIEPLLTDFSFAVIEEKPTLVKVERRTLCGTPLYMAPEVHMAGVYDAKMADIYSMGICLYEMLHGYKPFEGTYEIKSKELINRQLTCDYKFNPKLNISNNCKLLINQMLSPKADKRPKAKHVLKHPWFKYNQKLKSS